MIKEQFGWFIFGELKFETIDDAIVGIQNIAKKGIFKYGKYTVSAFGQCLESRDFILKVNNKGFYDKAFREKSGHWQNLNRYDLFNRKENLDKSGISYICLNEDADDFDYEYSRALAVAKDVAKTTGRTIDVFIYNGLSYSLHDRFLNKDLRGFKDEEFNQYKKKMCIASKKPVAKGLEQSRRMQSEIIKGIEG